MVTIYDPSFILVSLLSGPLHGAAQAQRCTDNNTVGWVGSDCETPTEWTALSARTHLTGTYSIKEPRWTVAELYLRVGTGQDEASGLTEGTKSIAFKEGATRCRHAKTCQAHTAEIYAGIRSLWGIFDQMEPHERDSRMEICSRHSHSGIFTEWATPWRCSSSKMHRQQHCRVGRVRL